MSARDHSDHEHEMVMPFVICESQGGPHNDDAFVSGWRLGQIDQLLGIDRASWAGLVRENELPQLDLIAMRHGCTVEREDAPGGWVFATVARIAS